MYISKAYEARDMMAALHYRYIIFARARDIIAALYYIIFAVHAT